MAAAAANPDCSPAVDDGQENNCKLFRCICCWSYCEPQIPRFAPGRDFIRVPADADIDADRPPWSVLIGCISLLEPFHNLRLHRFRVAASGRVLGNTDDTLQPVLTVSPVDEENNVVSHATATLGPDGARRLYGVCTLYPGVNGAFARGPPPAHATLHYPHSAFAVDLDAGSMSVSAAPPLPFSCGSYVIVSARGELWAPAVDETGRSDFDFRLVVRRLEHAGVNGDSDVDARWEEVAGVDMVYRPLVNSRTSGYYLQGYAVIRDRFILLSLIDSTFFCFNCAAGTLTPVATTTVRKSPYIPISGKAVHLGGDDDDGMVYFVRGVTLWAYDFSPEEGDILAPPMKVVDRLWPYHEEGCGSVVHLAGRMLCAVWINMDLPCGCAERHALITTFLVQGARSGDGEGGSFVPSGVRVLHSTCRRVGMLRTSAVPRYESFDYFCFLQEYLDHEALPLDSSMPISSTVEGCNFLQADEETPHDDDDDDDDDMPFCCRVFLSGGVPKLKECKSVTRPDFYFVCQDNDRSLVYHISTIGGKLTCHDKMLEPHLSLETISPGECVIDEPPSWHFVHQGSKLYVIPSVPGQNHYEVDASSKLYKVIEQERPGGVCFSVVSRAGQHIVALGDTLQDVYTLDEPNSKWLHMETSSSSVDLTREINISGFVDLIDDMFLVSDVGMTECFLLDLKKKEWFVVKHTDFWRKGLLCGRCLFANGFIYVCTGIGFAAFGLLKEDNSYCLGYAYLLEFPHTQFPDRKLVSFDSICKEDNPSSLVLCVVQGNFFNYPFTSHHGLTTTTVQVKLKKAADGRKVPVRIDHIDISDSTIDSPAWTNFAFSL